MVLILLRYVVVAGIVATCLYFLWKWAWKTSLTEPQKQELEKSLLEINNILENANSLPKVDVTKLKKAKEKIKKTLKEGR